MKMYKTDYSNTKIEEVEVQNKTEHFVILGGGRRDALRTKSRNYHDTFHDAKKFIVEKLESDEQVAKDKLHRIQSALGQAKSLKPKHNDIHTGR